MLLLEANRQYQNALEAHRMFPDDEETWISLQKAYVVMELAWLNSQVV